jgi:sugar phosphate isomerase/epimerase
MKKLTRRAFFGESIGAAAGPALLAASCSGAGRAARGAASHRFELGLASYTFREFGLDTTLAMAGRLGLTRIAVKSVHLPLESSESEVRAAADRIRAAGIDPYGCGVVYMTSEAEVDQAFVYARAGGMKLIVGVPQHDLLGRAEKRVRETGIQLALHNHGPGDLLYPTPQSILDKVGKSDPRVGVCLDIGHCQRSGLDPSEAAAACGARLLDVHLKDVTAPTAAGGPVEAGRGVIDIPRFLWTLAAIGFRGTAAFEYEKDGKDPLPGLAESVGYVRGVIAAKEKPGSNP